MPSSMFPINGKLMLKSTDGKLFLRSICFAALLSGAKLGNKS